MGVTIVPGIPAAPASLVSGGLDSGATIRSSRYPLVSSLKVEAGANVQVNDLSGNALRVYTNGSDATNTVSLATNPVTADQQGRIPGWVDAPDYDFVVSPGGGKPAYNFKVRRSPPGVFHVNSFGAVPMSFTINSGSTNVPDSQAAINAAITAASNTSSFSFTWRPELAFGAGSYLTSGNHAHVDNMPWKGRGRLSTQLYLKSGVNNPILSSVDTARRCDVFDMGFACQDPASHSGVFPIIQIASYMTVLRNLNVNAAVGSDGIWLTSASDGTGTDGVWLYDCVITGGLGVSGPARRALYIKGNAGNFHIIGGGQFDRFAEGTRWERDVAAFPADGINQAQHGEMRGVHFESTDGYCYVSKGGCSVHITGCRLEAGILLDENSHNNIIQGNRIFDSDNTGVAAPFIHNGGRNNITTPNFGLEHYPREEVPIERLYPVSLTRDSDFSARSTSGWTAVSGAALNKNIGAVNSTIRMWDRIPALPLVVGGAAGKGVSQVVSGLTAGDTFLFEAWWFSGVSSNQVGRCQFQLIDNDTATVLWDSGALSRPGIPTPSVAEWVDHWARVVLQLPAGVVNLKIQVTSPDAATFYLSRADLIRTILVNGGFDPGAGFVAGVAPGWTQTAGAGTPSQETGLVTSGQKLTVTAGQSITVGQTLDSSIDKNSSYLLRGRVYVNSGSKLRACMGWGNLDLDSPSDFWKVARARLFQEWEVLSMVFRPSAYTSLLIGLNSNGSEAASAIFDDLFLFPLRRSLDTREAVSEIIDLTAASTNYIVKSPLATDKRVRNLRFVYTVAATAVGPTIRVGIVGNTTAYGSVTGASTQNIGDILEVASGAAPPTSTVIRKNTPIVVTTSGAVANAGKGYLIVEYEG